MGSVLHTSRLLFMMRSVRLSGLVLVDDHEGVDDAGDDEQEDEA